MKLERHSAACTVFEGKIVVSDGLYSSSSSVEAFDHHENKWTYLPPIPYGRHDHGAVSMGNKMFLIGGNSRLTSLVFDSVSINFTYIKQLVKPKSFTYCHM